MPRPLPKTLGGSPDLREKAPEAAPTPETPDLLTDAVSETSSTEVAPDESAPQTTESSNSVPNSRQSIMPTSEAQRVLGDIGLPGIDKVERIDGEVESDSLAEDQIFGAPEEPAEIIHTAEAGIEIADRQRFEAGGVKKALDSLRQSERNAETDCLYDKIILDAADTMRYEAGGVKKALKFLDDNRLRTEDLQIAANSLYDRVILDAADTMRYEAGGVKKALKFLDDNSPRTTKGRETIDPLYDKIILDAADAMRYEAGGVKKALKFLDDQTPRTQQGSVDIARLRVEIAQSL